MKFTISDCVARINQALNYPALYYEDISHFFDQAIAELNTSLRVNVPNVTEMRAENTFDVSKSLNCVSLTTSPTTDPVIPIVNDNPTTAAPNISGNVCYYVDNTVTGSYANNALYILKNNNWEPVESAYGVYIDVNNLANPTYYTAVVIGYDTAYWSEVPKETVTDFSLTDYLPIDWIVLFLIPYVCFKFSVRNGDNGALFSDEFTQGFQQLQTSYNVPNNVRLSEVAHLPAYRNLAAANLDNLNSLVHTRAIYEHMRVPNGIPKIYNYAYEGGWDI